MKKTFNNFRTLAALLMAGAAFAACSSDDNIIENQQPANPGEQVYTLTINASKGDGTTRALDLDGTKLVASWTNGDVLTVYNQSTFEALGGTLTASNASGSTATFSGALTGTIGVGDELILNYQEHNYFTEFPNQDGTLKGTNGAEKYDLANAHVTVASVDAGNITIEEPSASFTTWTAMLKLTLQDGSSNPLNATSLKISVDGIGELLAFSSIDADASTANGDGILYFALPCANEVANAKSTTTAALETATVTFTATVGGKTYTATKTGYKFIAGKYYATTLTMTEVVPSFTINAGGTKVLFAPGNLQATYNGSSWTWGFAANQWDYIGITAGNTYINGNGTMSAPGTVDFFGWVGASSIWGGVAQYGISNSVESHNVNGYGDVADEALKSDWGNTISDGYTWRTLTEEEWTYVISTRAIGTALPCEDHARYTKATINTDNGSGGVNGLILFPDGLTLDTSEFTNFGDANGYSNYATLCTTAEWAALSAKGCVFLPAAGSKDANTGMEGRYWTTTSYKTNPGYARYVDITTTGYVSVRSAPRCNGFSVRLAREVE